MVHRNTPKHSRTKAKTILRLPDLEQSKTAVLHSLGAASPQESYRYAIDEFIGWIVPNRVWRFNRTVVRYRFFLELKNLAPSTINVRLAAVRRLAYEALLQLHGNLSELYGVSTLFLKTLHFHNPPRMKRNPSSSSLSNSALSNHAVLGRSHGACQIVHRRRQ